MNQSARSSLSPAVIEQMIRVRREIHEHPELSREEHATQDKVKTELNAAGLTNITDIAGTGLLVDIAGDQGKTVLLRADMDALPIHEDRPDLPFASKNKGVMHACGHDAHTAILLGAAITLNRMSAQLPGRVKCIFQPSEEAEPLGGREVVQSGVLDGVDVAIALHVDPNLRAGSVGLKAGPLLAGGMEFTIRIEGKSSHAARPHLGIDTICVAASIIQELQKIPSRHIDPLDPAVVTIGKIHGGTAKNIIAEQTVIEGTVRMLSEKLRRQMPLLVEQIAHGVAQAHGAKALVEMSEGEPVLENDPQVIDLLRNAANDVLDPGQVVELSRGSMGSEDFAFYTQVVPGAMFRLGVRAAGDTDGFSLHHPKFNVDESALAVGANVLIEATRQFLHNAD